jgi:hypothetical protein
MNIIIEDFLETAEGLDFVEEFQDIFGGHFGHVNMSNNVLYQSNTNKKVYAIPDWEKLEDFKSVIIDSIKQNHDLLPVRYKYYHIVTDPKALY